MSGLIPGDRPGHGDLNKTEGIPDAKAVQLKDSNILSVNSVNQ